MSEVNIDGEKPNRAGPTPSVWTPADVARIDLGAAHLAPLIQADDFERISPEVDIWDAWPVQLADGHPAPLAGGATLWMALAAPHFPDPDKRHGHARIHLLLRSAQGWRDLGPAMPDGFSPGSREWSGSAVLDPKTWSLTLYFTATGRRNEANLTFEQRLFRAEATLTSDGDGYQLVGWQGLQEFVVPDPAFYMPSDAGTGVIGTIKAFRDPAFFRDPVDGQDHVFFAASSAGSQSHYNGVIGSATAARNPNDNWLITPPIMTANDVNNELERPHVIFNGEYYYLFWSTQRHVFNSDGPVGPTGLYGMASRSLGGGWKPLNGTGLVFANPPEAAAQSYSWLVMPDLQVTSFVDDWGLKSGSEGRRFGATFAPMLKLKLNGLNAGLAD